MSLSAGKPPQACFLRYTNSCVRWGTGVVTQLTDVLLP